MFVVALHRRRVFSADGDGVKLVDEDDARPALTRLVEQVTNTRGAHAHEHLHELGTRAREERDAGFAREASRHESLARPRRPAEQHAHRDGRARRFVPLVIAKVRDKLLHLLADDVDTRDVLQSHPGLLLGVVNLCGARVHQSAALRGVILHLVPDAPDEPADQRRGRHRGGGPEEQLQGRVLPRDDVDAFLNQQLVQRGVVR